MSSSKITKRKIFFLSFIFVLSLFLYVLLLTPSSKNTLTKKKEMPDFCQSDKRFGEIPGNGKTYCGPTAVSNILMYLDKNGFNNLVENTSDIYKDQVNLIKLLGSQNYMKTDIKNGTEPYELMKGLEKYIQDKRYDIKINYRGWMHGGEFIIDRHPSPQWIVNEIKNSSNAILHIGWYKYDKEKDYYKRVSGHFVTIKNFTGKDTDQDLKIYIHDPALRSGINSSSEECKLVLINSGKLSSWENYHERPAKGYYKLDGIKIKENADFGIIDGIISFKIQ